ncbi:hypothetical protein LMH87_010627 [Akanthomyces muscarius]|uniref:Uncharacterized protein n=1 Tax=Akanthomyces muscarius TaxID=2231603 RepID=A0A9W8UND9_AKAMU|nr:hypothetical protein LMH87_010627 [Akanthomyces muscarius]KAJ4154166.1 hypothetical protein LMH87_010627 [Akanthomyces muscarius]
MFEQWEYLEHGLGAWAEAHPAVGRSRTTLPRSKQYILAHAVSRNRLFNQYGIAALSCSASKLLGRQFTNKPSLQRDTGVNAGLITTEVAPTAADRH